MKNYLVITILFLTLNLQAQTMDTLPYYQIPDYPTEYNAATVTARLIDGLGYRYYWATEGLRIEDIAYKPSEDARTLDETLDHLVGLSEMIVNAVLQQPNVRPQPETDYSFEEKRRLTLENLKKAADFLRNGTSEDLEKMQIVFQRGENTSEFEFWHQFNGPIADALWHTGQLVVFRRASGNPLNPKVNVFMGKNRN